MESLFIFPSSRSHEDAEEEWDQAEDDGDCQKDEGDHWSGVMETATRRTTVLKWGFNSF